MKNTTNDELLKNLEIMKEILITNMQTSYETYCELLAKINILCYQILKDDE